MAFVQDIPYGIPEFEDDGITRSGLSPPPLILLTGYGDCDSKVTLFAGILRHLIDPADILFLRPEGVAHVLTAIRGKPTRGQRSITYEGHSFVLADTAGPGRLALGKADDSWAGTRSFAVEPFTLKTLPFHADADYGPQGPPVFRDPSGGQEETGPAVASGPPSEPPCEEAPPMDVEPDEGSEEAAPSPHEEALVLSFQDGEWVLRSTDQARPLSLRCNGMLSFREIEDEGGSDRYELVCEEDPPSLP
jgi:hypothetical protein